MSELEKVFVTDVAEDLDEVSAIRLVDLVNVWEPDTFAPFTGDKEQWELLGNSEFQVEYVVTWRQVIITRVRRVKGES